VEKTLETIEPDTLHDPAERKKGRYGFRARLGGVRAVLQRIVTKPQYLFLVIATIFGLMMVVINPAFHVSDEIAHFQKSYSLSQGHLLPVSHWQEGETLHGFVLPKSLGQTVVTIKFERATRLMKPSDTVAGFDVPLKAGDTIFYDNAVIGYYPPVQYIPQAVAMAVGRVFGAPMLALLYLGRLFNLLAWLGIVFLAIAITPVMKWPLFLLGIMPMNIHQAASLSGDCVTVGLSLLTVAFFLRLALAEDKPIIQSSDYVYMFLLGVGMALVKQPYFLLMLLFFMIPSERLGGRKRYFIVGALLIIVTFGVGLGWSLMEKGRIVQVSAAVNQAEQMKFILSNPVTFARILVRTFLYWKLDFVSTSVGAIGLMESTFPIWFGFLYFFTLVSTVAIDSGTPVVKPRQKLVSTGTMVLTGVAVMTATYLFGTVVRGPMVTGIYGRYWIPLIPLLLLLFKNKSIKYEKGKWFYAFMWAFSLFALIFSGYMVLQTFYY
jgi:uncharacterized membrane protein